MRTIAEHDRHREKINWPSGPQYVQRLDFSSQAGASIVMLSPNVPAQAGRGKDVRLQPRSGPDFACSRMVGLCHRFFLNITRATPQPRAATVMNAVM
jgi:hypothetical protein